MAKARGPRPASPIEDFGAESTAGQTYYDIRCDLQGEAATTITANRIHKFLPPPNQLAAITKAWKQGAAPPERKPRLGDRQGRGQ